MESVSDYNFKAAGPECEYKAEKRLSRLNHNNKKQACACFLGGYAWPVSRLYLSISCSSVST